MELFDSRTYEASPFVYLKDYRQVWSWSAFLWNIQGIAFQQSRPSIQCRPISSHAVLQFATAKPKCRQLLNHRVLISAFGELIPISFFS